MVIRRLSLVLLSLALSISLAKAETFTGSGFFVSNSGLFITNHHVVEAANDVRIRTTDGRVYSAKVVRADPTSDLALLKIEGRTVRPLGIAPSTGIRRGEPVFALGFPQVQIQGLEPKLTEGSISSLSGVADDPRHFQISNPIQPGNSGGPLVLEDGRVVGVVVASLSARATQRAFGATPQNVNYAIKSSLLLEFLAGQNTSPRAMSDAKPMRRTDMIAQVEQSIGLVIASTSQPERRTTEVAPPPPPRSVAVESTSYPQKPITMFVPFAHGGPADAMGRKVAEALSRALGVPVAVTNHVGEAGLTGTRIVAKAAADGYTLLFQNTSVLWTPLAQGLDGMSALSGLGNLCKTRPRAAQSTR